MFPGLQEQKAYFGACERAFMGLRICSREFIQGLKLGRHSSGNDEQ